MPQQRQRARQRGRSTILSHAFARSEVSPRLPPSTAVFHRRLIVLNFSFSGLFVSWLQKHADTIVKVFATSIAMLFTALVSLAFFQLVPTLQLFIGIVVACCSLSLYFVPPELGAGAGAPTLPLTLGAGGGVVEVHCSKCFAVTTAVLPRGLGKGSGLGPGGHGTGGLGGVGVAGSGGGSAAPADWAGGGAGAGGGMGVAGGGAVVVNTQAEALGKDAARRSPSGQRRRGPTTACSVNDVPAKTKAVRAPLAAACACLTPLFGTRLRIDPSSRSHHRARRFPPGLR